MPNKTFLFNISHKSSAIALSVLFLLIKLPLASANAESVSAISTTLPSQTKISPGNAALPWDKDCVSSKPILTLSDLRDKSWQSAVKSGALTWNKVGSVIKINTTARISDEQRAVQPLDFYGFEIPVKLAKCEIRVINAKLFRKTYDAAARNYFYPKPATPGWVQPYHDPKNPKYAFAYLIVLNDIDYAFSVSNPTDKKKLDLQTIALHELGHALGLGSIEVWGAVMNDKGDLDRIMIFKFGQQKRSLTQYDKDELIKLYPNSPTASKPTLTLNQQSSCREGTSKAFEIVYAFPQGTQFEIKGTNGLGWWLVPINMPEKTRKTSCWIYGQGNTVSGEISKVPAVATPPLPEPVPVPAQNGKMPIYDFYSQAVIDYISCAKASSYQWEKDVWSETGEAVYFSSALYGNAPYGVYERDAQQICGW